MSSTEPPAPVSRALCVSIHDVAPATWRACEILMAAVRDVADIPMTLLVVPNYHHGPKPTDISDAGFTRVLEAERQRGCELALHGYTHWDDGPPPRNLYEYAKRHWYTAREGEFSALDEKEAEKRIRLGLDWFGERDWKPEGFIAPAWLPSAGTWAMLSTTAFAYTCTLSRFYLLRQRRWLHSAAITYSTRSPVRRELSRHYTRAHLMMAGETPLLRLVLHPADAQFSKVIAHHQQVITLMLRKRRAMTKVAFAAAQ